MKIFVPTLNGLKFAPLNYFQNCGDNNPSLSPNFRTPDNTLMYQEIEANQNQNIRYNIGINYLREPAMPYTPCDTIPIQLKSSFDSWIEHKLIVYDACDMQTPLQTIIFPNNDVSFTNNREFSVKYTGVKLAAVASDPTKMYIYFEQGEKFDSMWFYLGKYFLNGDLPTELSSLINDVIAIENANTNNCSMLPFAIEYVSYLNSFAIKVEHPFDPNYPTGSAIFTHRRDNYNTLRVNLDLSPYNGKNLRLKIVANQGNPGEATIISEPLMIRKNLPGMLRISWEHSTDKFFTEFYKTQFHPFAYLPMRLFDILPDEIEDEQMTTDTGKQILIQSTYSERYNIVGWLMPRWMVRLVDLIFKLDTVKINGEQYQKIGKLEAEQETDRSDRFKISLNVNKVKANGVYDDNYDFAHQVLPESYKYLKIDEAGNKLKIDSNNFLKINP